jgi:hypothetical protein
MKNKLNYIRQKFTVAFIFLCCIYVMLALCSDVFFMYLESSNQKELERDLINRVEWKLDATYKNK